MNDDAIRQRARDFIANAVPPPAPRVTVPEWGRVGRSHQGTYLVETLIAIPREAVEGEGEPVDEERLKAEITTLRRLFWLSHGCPIEALYGDDGEMQCNASGCRIDFKRDSIEDIEHRLHQRGLERLADMELAKRFGPDDAEGLVAGRILSTSIATLVRRCAVLIRDEQEKPLPDNALIGALCDAVRVAREHADSTSRRLDRLRRR